ncbi:two-component system sensor histidine kinase RegB [Rhodovulum imhoffii]|uniref:histidine kinase n=1 Tax=Rhodovulum imhoffii TaxID=365340 RepID=A0A2T5BRM1_9RHOB|nr:ActS/PrrB/RegB family redox-sensitive histidine kinase [Rhodovulum imhoffii]MBK5934054.1 two-component sensor histidine kinase [Rhodovulum imhoffii]PTN01939.1 two-component system sensor histidine kinase RegB [Rhodovulum imhoffii]
METPKNQQAPIERSHWIRLRTLVLLRWVAITGQLVAITVAWVNFDVRLELGWSLLAIGIAIIANMIWLFVYPESKRLTESETLLALLFDLGQLSFLLFLSGGLNNPFALLLLTPVIISATALRFRSTLLMGVITITIATFLVFFYMPLTTVGGPMPQLPPIFLFGFWAAIVIGVVFLALYAGRVASEINSMSDALLATQMALAREQKLTDLGGVVAAYAHELGTPLATIKLVSSELMEDLSDKEDLRDDAALIRDQADRCRDILRSMGRAGKDDLQMHTAPIGSVINEAAEPHQDRGTKIISTVAPGPGVMTQQPVIRRRPEIIHGLRNFIQNAVDFAATTVWVEANWTDSELTVRIMDDGPGFPPHLIGRIGDPFVRKRKTEQEAPERPGYEGMGLGLFIAKTLLERTGAVLSFANGSDPFLASTEQPERSGAVIEVIWSLEAVLPDPATGSALGENQRIEA